jgi:23S rRNA A2030 N6-methylase RlmJ
VALPPASVALEALQPGVDPFRDHGCPTEGRLREGLCDAPVMANHKAGNVGDVFKHLILAEVLEEVRASGKPASYWDIYAGDATYRFYDPTPEQTWGVLKVLESKSLESSTYRGLLDGFLRTKTLPGSPAIALSLLEEGSLRFVDRDASSLQSIKSFAVAGGVPSRSTFTYEGEAPHHLRQFLDDPGAHDGRETVALIDPFDPRDGKRGARPLDQFMWCVQRGIKTLLWYPIMRKRPTGAMRKELEQSAREHGAIGRVSDAELALDVSREPRLKANPKLHGCGFAFGNLDAVALLDRMRLRDAMERELYPHSTLSYGDVSVVGVAGTAPSAEREQV